MSFRDVVEQATKAVQFERIVVVGLLVILGLTLLQSFVLVLLAPASESAQFALAFFKDIAMFLGGALANSIRHKETNTDGRGE